MRCDEWCGYPPEYCDCKKEDVKVSELKMDSVIGAPCKHGSAAPFCDKCEIEQLRARLAEHEANPDWVKAGNGTLHGAIDHWQQRAAEAEAKLAEANEFIEAVSAQCESVEAQLVPLLESQSGEAVYVVVCPSKGERHNTEFVEIETSVGKSISVPWSEYKGALKRIGPLYTSPPAAKVPEWIDVNLMLPDNDTNVIGCCDDDVFECHHYDDGCFGDCVGEPVKVEYWMDKPESPYQTGQVSAQGGGTNV